MVGDLDCSFPRVQKQELASRCGSLRDVASGVPQCTERAIDAIFHPCLGRRSDFQGQDIRDQFNRTTVAVEKESRLGPCAVQELLDPPAENTDPIHGWL